jgi:hypothetical protein
MYTHLGAGAIIFLSYLVGPIAALPDSQGIKIVRDLPASAAAVPWNAMPRINLLYLQKRRCQVY